jgi:hypothetical protein
MLNRFVPKSGRDLRSDITGEFFGMWLASIHRFGLIIALAAAPAAALAQNGAPLPNAAYAVASPPSNPMDNSTADAELTPEETAALSNALSNDLSGLSSTRSAKPLRLPSLSGPKGLDASRTDKDSSTTMVLKQPLPIDWDAKVGADLGLRAAPSLTYSPDPWKAGSANDRGSGAAWASVGVVPSLATVDARVDPSNDQGRVGTTFKRSMPVGSRFSVTVQNSFSVTETFSASSPASSDIPMMTVPMTGAPTPQVWGSEKAAKFDILSTGTSFGAKVANNSTDPVTHNQFSAEQKVYGPLNVTTAVTDVGQTTTSKSITARFKLNW